MLREGRFRVPSSVVVRVKSVEVERNQQEAQGMPAEVSAAPATNVAYPATRIIGITGEVNAKVFPHRRVCL